MKALIPALALGMAFSTSTLAMSAAPDTGYTATKHPLVFVPGFSGFDTAAGVVDYWYKIPAALQKDGAQVFVTSVAAMNSTEVRGEQLITEVERILAMTGASKVNLIGHSQGSPTARYVASVRPDLVASVTGVSGANKGTAVADGFSGMAESSDALAWLIKTFGDALANTIDFLAGAGFEQDMMAAIASLTTEESAQFNQRHPQAVPVTACGDGEPVVNGIHYYSWGGDKPLTNVLDISDVMTGVASLFFPIGVRNDGIVSSCGTHLGMLIRDNFNMNHLDAVNQVFGLHALTDTDPVEIYRTHANRLKQAGL